ncbi:MFS transporter [Mesorhizobium sp. VNQ89]|uniref:MFS transporter n=1 Tax=Mesorhizobium quangtriensis TaxID=3157709 RepID=UPI0032B8044A
MPDLSQTAPQSRTIPRLALIALAGATLLAALGISIVSVALPTLAGAFSVSISGVQWIVTAYLVSVTVMVVIAGRLSDRYGHRRILLSGLCIFVLSALLCAVSTTLQMLVAGRLLQGVGGAILMVVPMSIARETIARERMGSAMGLLGSMSAIGTALGPSAGGILIAAFGWRASFIALAVLALPVALASLVAIPRTVIAKTQHLGKRTAVLSTIGSRRLGSGLAMNVLVAVVMISTLSIGPFYLTFALDLHVAAVGIIMSAGPIMSAISGVPAGRATDRFTTSTVITAGLLTTIFGLICLASLPRLFGVAGYVVALCLLTPGFQLFLAANNTEVMMSAPEDRKGTTSGLLSLSRNLGFIVGASAMPGLFSVAAGSGAIQAVSPEAVAFAFTATFLGCAALALLALLLARAFHPARLQ